MKSATTSRMPIVLSLAIIGITTTLARAVLAESSIETTVIPDNITFAVPLYRCAVPSLTARIAKSTGIPAGIESVPDCAHVDRRPPPNLPPTVTFLGTTVADALDALIAFDPRYRWTETDGVLLVRPIDAWNDPKHFLSTTVAAFGLDDQNILSAATMLNQAIRGLTIHAPTLDIPARTAEAAQHFSMAPTTASIVELLNDVVRAHGASYWTVNYCRPLRDAEYATFMLMTFDGAGIGGAPMSKLLPGDEPPMDCPRTSSN